MKTILKRSPGNSADIYADANTRDRIHKHISDRNDVITDDDIKNATVPGVTPGTNNPYEEFSFDYNLVEPPVEIGNPLEIR